MKSTTLSFIVLLLLVSACANPDASAPGLEAGDTPSAGSPGGSGGYAPALRACTRLHGECSAACQGPWGYDCHADVATCVENYTIDYTPDFDDPLIDEERAQQCAEQVEEQPCDWLEPDTLECEFAIVEQCSNDGDELGTPYSPFLATAVEPNAEVVVDLCPDVPEFFALQLESGTVLDVHRVDERWLGRVELMQLQRSSSGESVLHEYRHDDPVPADGEYLVRLESHDRIVQGVVFAARHSGGE